MWGDNVLYDTISYGEVASAPDIDSILTPWLIIISGNCEIFEKTTMTSLHANSYAARGRSSHVFRKDIAYLNSEAINTFNCRWTILKIDVVHRDIFRTIQHDICAIVPIERCSRWTGIGTPRVSVGLDLDIFKLKPMAIATSDTLGIGCMVNYDVPEGHIFSSDPDHSVELSAACTRWLAIKDLVLDHNIVLPYSYCFVNLFVLGASVFFWTIVKV